MSLLLCVSEKVRQEYDYITISYMILKIASTLLEWCFMPFSSHGVDIGRMSVTFNLDPLKLVPLELKYLAPGHSENLLLLLTMQPHLCMTTVMKLLLKTSEVFTMAYLENWMTTGLYQYVSVCLTQRSQKLRNVCGIERWAAPVLGCKKCLVSHFSPLLYRQA